MGNNKKILLLGAGFSANFGAPVASQIWNDIFNCRNIQESKRLRAILKSYRKNSDFEGFYEKILNGDSSEEEKKVVAKLLLEIFYRINTHLDEALRNPGFFNVSLIKLFQFLQQFSNMQLGKGFIFSLNQDLLIEKLINQYLRKDDKQVSVAYAGCINTPFIEPEWEIILPTQDQMQNWLVTPNLGGSLYKPRQFPWYIKLHGSSGWKTQNNILNKLVIGKNKSHQISNEPLLKWYIDIFGKVLEDKVDIWIIGYSFSDPHINQLLLKSMKKYQSSLFVIDTKSHNDFMENLRENSTNEFYMAVEDHLSGYFSFLLKQIFPEGQNIFQMYHGEAIRQALHNEKVSSTLDNFVKV